MVFFNFLFVLCCFYLCYVPLFYFFQAIRHENDPNKGFDVVQII